MSRTTLIALSLLTSILADPALAQNDHEITFSIGDQDDDSVRLRIRRDDWIDHDGDRGDYNWSQRLALSDLKGLSREQINRGGPISFSLVRPAGRFDCSGTARDREADGDCSFTSNEAFDRLLADRGIEKPTRYQRYGLAMSGVDSDVIDAVIKEGLGTPTPEQLIRLGIFKVTPDFIRSMAHIDGMPIRIRDLIQFKIFKVTPEMVKDYASLGYRNLTANDLVQFSMFKVSPQTIRAFVDAGYRDLPARDLIQLSMFRVSPETLRGFRDAGYGHLSTRDLQQFGIFRVTPEYIRDLAALGYRDIPAATIVRMKMMGVSPAYVRSMNDRANAKLSPEELIRRRTTPQFTWSRDWRDERRNDGRRARD